MTVQDLIQEKEKELIIIEQSLKRNTENGNRYLIVKREIQEELVCRFIKDLKKLMV